MDEMTITTPEVEATEATPAPRSAPPASNESDLSWLPEKYRVLKADGEVDVLESSKKLGKGYVHAEKRMSAGQRSRAPESPQAYTFTPPEQFKELAFNPENLGAFQQRAHEAGLTQGQFEFVMGEYFEHAGQLAQHFQQGAAESAPKQPTVDDAKAQLAQVWPDQAEMARNLRYAERAVSTMPESLQEAVKAKYGTDALFWQFAAQFGREVGEDRPATPPGGAAPLANLEEVMRSDAYRNPKHPDHAKVSAQVQRHFRAMSGEGEVV